MVDLDLAPAAPAALPLTTPSEPSGAPAWPLGHEPMRRGALGAWWAQGLRSALLLRPRWEGLQVTPSVLAVLALVSVAAAVGLERLFIDGPAVFYAPGLLSSLTWLMVWAWVCWLMVPPQAMVEARATSTTSAAGKAPSAAALLSMMLAQSLATIAGVSLALLPIARGEVDLRQAFGTPGLWVAMLLPAAWPLLAQVLLLWRGASARPRAKAVGSMLLCAVAGCSITNPEFFRRWYPDPAAMEDESGDSAGEFSFTQETLELQPRLLAERLDALQPQRKGLIDVYAITFAPYAEADVFRRESGMVAQVVQQRFDAQGRVIQLVNHRDAAREWPWATPLNLQRAIQRVSRLMDHEQDVLFIHLTSHGAQSGELAASFWPLDVAPVTPDALKAWLDTAGIRHRILSISACYSGSWVPALAEPDTLVMTAADAEHTSYGCGRRSDLTFFGRAMYDEQLRHTRSFERAHAEARLVIEQREKEAGKTDGYSNPQIAMGERMRAHLARLEAQLESAAPSQ
ncbi:C13 family peptidase [Ideonella sp. DXS29W]|uniref:C13 family peptidase n=1 Tax=Ideonella lacteola TaxID=2984193 RepID=A0ABU9BVX8_9BURK